MKKLTNCPSCQTPIYEKIHRCPECDYKFFELEISGGFEIGYDMLIEPITTIKKYSLSVAQKKYFIIPVFILFILIFYYLVGPIIRFPLILMMPIIEMFIWTGMIILGFIAWYGATIISLSVGMNLLKKPIQFMQISQIINVAMINFGYFLFSGLFFRIISIQYENTHEREFYFIAQFLTGTLILIGFFLFCYYIGKGLSERSNLSTGKVLLMSYFVPIGFFIFILITILLFAAGVLWG